MARNIERRAARGLSPRTATDMAARRSAAGWDEAGGNGDGGGCDARVVHLDTDELDREAVLRRVLAVMNGRDD